MYKILISGYYGFHNIGDEAVLRCVTERLGSAVQDVDLTILSNDPADTREKYHVNSIPRMNPFKVLRAITKTDMLISGGGSLLQDVTSRFSILYYLTIIFLALLLKKRVFIYSQGIGPIQSKFSRFLTGKLLKRVDGIAVRDEKSAKLLEEIGIPPDSISVTADPVLRLEKADMATGRDILASLGIDRRSGRLLVGWAVKDAGKQFLDEIEKSVRYLKKAYNADSVLIPFHYEQDAKVIKALAGRLGDNAYYVTEKHLTDEMLSIIGNLDLLVGVRLHSLIYAAVSDVPSIGISYDPKIDAFLESISRRSVSDTRSFSLEKFQPAVEEVLAHREEIQKETASRVASLRRKLDRNDQMVLNLAQRKETAPKSKKGGIASAIGGVMLITILAKIFGILREAVQASVFGSLDAFYAGYNKTIYLFTTAAYAMCIAAVPIITKEMEKSRKDGERAANNLTTFSLILSLIALGVWELLSFTPLSGFVYGEDPSVIPFVRIMALSLPVIVVAYLMVALFQSLDHFALQGSMSLPHSLFLIAYLLIFGKTDSIITYVWLVCVAWVLQFAMCLPYVVKEKYLYRPRLDFRSGYLRSFVKTSLVTIITSSMYLFCYLLDASAAEKMGAGTTSAFYYADKLFTPLTTTFIYSISAVLFPKLNREYTRSDPKAYKQYVWSITSTTLIVVFPVCALLMVFGGPILKVLFESGNFTPEATEITTRIFVMYALGMAGFSVMDLVNKAFFTMNRSLPPLLISLGTIAVNLVLNTLFGLSGELVALTTAISMTVGAAITLFVMFRRENILNLTPAIKSLMASIIMGATAYGLKFLFVSMRDGKILLILKCGSIGVLVMILFLLLCFLFRIEVITNILKRKKA